MQNIKKLENGTFSEQLKTFLKRLTFKTSFEIVQLKSLSSTFNSCVNALSNSI